MFYFTWAPGTFPHNLPALFNARRATFVPLTEPLNLSPFYIVFTLTPGGIGDVF